MSSIIKVDTIQDQDGNNIINENANTITIGASGDTITIPSGATLANNGTATGFASIAWQSTIVTTSTLTAVAGNGYWIDTTSNACTVTLPGSASVGDQIIFVDYARTWGTNAVTIDQNSLNFQGNSTPNPVYDTDGESVHIVYSGATNGWIPVDDGAVAFETPQTYDIDFLVVAGGGAGGFDDGGGGGAGGYRTSTQTINQGIAITITVGDGGSAPTAYVDANNGSDSSISGSGLTTITSAGGGGAKGYNNAGNSGGSGGGGAGHTTSAGGSGNTPSTSPSQGNNGGSSSAPSGSYGGGGGGAGEAGNTDGGGQGGDGTASSITGSSVTYAGGGGGINRITSTPIVGGDGGGGAGGVNTPNTSGTAGTANTGGGGGGGAGSAPVKTGGNGGKGVVILAFPLADFSNTTTGSPTESDDGTTKVLIFNGDGSYTT
jgi:hypothetical protein